MEREHAVEAVKLLRTAQDALTEYRLFTERVGSFRPPISDLALLDLLDEHDEVNDGDRALTESPDQVMVEVLVFKEVVKIDSSGYAWQGFMDDASDMLEREGLSAEVAEEAVTE